MINLPRQHIAHLPTPIEFLPRLTGLLGGPKIYIKRDDQTGLAFGGNKTRKLEYLLAEAEAAGARTLITAGAIQSNHCRQTAAAAARYQLDCILVLIGEEPEAPTGNLLLDELFGAEIHWTNKGTREEILKKTFREAQDKGRKPYLIPYGGSSPTGATGYIYAIAELIAQRDSSPLNGSLPNWIVVATGSGGTQAGMVLGAQLFGFPGRILGISVDEPAERLVNHIARLITATADFLDITRDVSERDILVNDDYLGDGYGVLGKPEREALQLFARSEGLLLDPVYTGRAGAGMIDLIRSGYFQPQDNVLFWHTGGAPAIFADLYSDHLLMS